jgi:hypothetical protein
MNPGTARTTPSLRIEEFAITHFRTFVGRTVIPFRGGGSASDAIATFHGDNGSGKSNALAALQLFFDALLKYLHTDDNPKGEPVKVEWLKEGTEESHSISFRDRPANVDEPTELEVRFSDERLGTLRVSFIPAGKLVRLRVDRRPGSAISRAERDQLLTWIETPFGPDSQPFAILDSHRRGTLRATATDNAYALDDRVAEKLLSLRTSFNPQDRTRWRAFIETLQRFATFRGKEISVDRLKSTRPAELTFEEPGRYVLPLRELSSGEQQLVRLCATSVMINSAILAIEEPELSLDFTNQRLFMEILQSQVESGLRDQLIFESHVPTFDGPSVIRFERGPAGETRVKRVSRAEDAPRQQLTQRAQAQGALERWVTRDGYTQLPDIMRDALHLKDGGQLWFIKGKQAWEAWPEDELTALLAGERQTEEDDG